MGFGNHKFFIQFLFYAGLTLLNIGLSCLISLDNIQLDNELEGTIGTFAGISLSFTVLSLCAFHLYLIITNKSTLELRRHEKFNVFDTENKKANCSQIFGTNTLAYIFPIKAKTTINGVVYPLRIRNTQGEVIILSNKLII